MGQTKFFGKILIPVSFPIICIIISQSGLSNDTLLVSKLAILEIISFRIMLESLFSIEILYVLFGFIDGINSITFYLSPNINKIIFPVMTNKSSTICTFEIASIRNFYMYSIDIK